MSNELDIELSQKYKRRQKTETRLKNHLSQLLLLAIFISNLSWAQQNTNAAASRNDLVADNMLLWQRENGGWPKDTYNVFFDDSKTDIDNDINKEKTTAYKV